MEDTIKQGSQFQHCFSIDEYRSFDNCGRDLIIAPVVRPCMIEAVLSVYISKTQPTVSDFSISEAYI